MSHRNYLRRNFPPEIDNGFNIVPSSMHVNTTLIFAWSVLTPTVPFVSELYCLPYRGSSNFPPRFQY